MGRSAIASLVVHGGLALWLVSRPAMSKTPPTAPATVVEFLVVADPPGGDDRTEPRTAPTPARTREEAEVVRAPVARRGNAGRETRQPGRDTPVADRAPDGPGGDVESAGAGALRMRGLAPRTALDSIGSGGGGGGEPSAERPSWMPGGAKGGAGPSAPGLGRPSGAGTTTHAQPGFRAVVRQDGRVDLIDAPNVEVEYGGVGPGMIFIGGHFDLTDWVERLAGNDPYAYEKHRFLERTREQRAALIARHESEQRREATMRLRGHLRGLWDDASRPIAQRRRLLFDLWDECDVDAAGPLGKAAVLARATIEGFIRRRLPKGHEAAFSADELARLNRLRTSRARFAPYDSP